MINYRILNKIGISNTNNSKSYSMKNIISVYMHTIMIMSLIRYRKHSVIYGKLNQVCSDSNLGFFKVLFRKD